jgi:hypothetical protein
MLKENELVMLILGLGVIFLIFMNMDHVRKIRFWKTLVFSYFILIGGWLFTVLEGLFLENLLNLLEHACYLLSAIFMSIWAWRSTRFKKLEDRV